MSVRFGMVAILSSSVEQHHVRSSYEPTPPDQPLEPRWFARAAGARIENLRASRSHRIPGSQRFL